MIIANLHGAARDRTVTWDTVAEVVDGVEGELNLFAAHVEDRVLARIEAAHVGLSATLTEACAAAFEQPYATHSSVCAPRPSFPMSCRRTSSSSRVSRQACVAVRPSSWMRGSWGRRSSGTASR